MTANNAALQPQNGRRLQPYFTAVCVALRESDPDVTQNSIADDVGLKSPRSIERFETGESWPHMSLDTYAAAYAKAGGLSDPRLIYVMAVEFWMREHPEMRPLTAREIRRLDVEEAGEPRLKALIQKVKQAGAIERARAGSEERPTSTRRRRATGG